MTNARRLTDRTDRCRSRGRARARAGDWLDPSAGLLAGKAIKLLELGGGPGLQEQMGGVLQEIAGGSLGG